MSQSLLLVVAVALVDADRRVLIAQRPQGKAMAGLQTAVRESRISGTVVFLHTGGAPALFADGYAGALS